jgi:hypothetical protein
MGTRHHYRRSDLFLLRMWSEEAADASGNIEWRGKVQRVVDGEAHTFEDWQGLVRLLCQMLPERVARDSDAERHWESSTDGETR